MHITHRPSLAQPQWSRSLCTENSLQFFNFKGSTRPQALVRLQLIGPSQIDLRHSLEGWQSSYRLHTVIHYCCSRTLHVGFGEHHPQTQNNETLDTLKVTSTINGAYLHSFHTQTYRSNKHCKHIGEQQTQPHTSICLYKSKAYMYNGYLLKALYQCQYTYRYNKHCKHLGEQQTQSHNPSGLYKSKAYTYDGCLFKPFLVQFLFPQSIKSAKEHK